MIQQQKTKPNPKSQCEGGYMLSVLVSGKDKRSALRAFKFSSALTEGKGDDRVITPNLTPVLL